VGIKKSQWEAELKYEQKKGECVTLYSLWKLQRLRIHFQIWLTRHTNVRKKLANEPRLEISTEIEPSYLYEASPHSQKPKIMPL
jgi:hypothetical protein